MTTRDAFMDAFYAELESRLENKCAAGPRMDGAWTFHVEEAARRLAELATGTGEPK